LEAQSALTDVDILQFALNLEYLEAEFYTVGVFGKTIEQLGIPVDGVGTAGPTTGGQKVSFTTAGLPIQRAVEEIGLDERNHVVVLRNALSARNVAPIAKPAIDLGSVRQGFGNDLEFLALARLLEDLGVTAYNGAAPLLMDKTLLGIVARIHAAEAAHVGNIRLQTASAGVTTAQADGVDILPPPTGTRYISVDRQGLTAVRTPGQVLYLAYGNRADATSGGFFPNGFNGTIRTSSAAA